MIKKLFESLILLLVALFFLPVASKADNSLPLPEELTKLTNFVLPQGKSWEDKHFREALLKGRQRKQYYCLVNDDNKKIKADKLIEYCNSHNYLHGNYHTKTIKAFGTGGVETITEFEFLPKELYPNYMFESHDNSGTSFNSLTQKGSVYFYNLYSDFILLDGALWSGNIVNGKIDGQGTGFYFTDNKKGLFHYFTGTFKEGVPQGKVIYHIIGGNFPYQINVGNWHEGMASFQVSNGKNFSSGGDYGFLTMNGDKLSVALNPIYANVISDFQNGKATVVRKIITSKETKLEEIVIDKSGNFIDYSVEQKRQQQLLAAEQKRQEELRKKQEQLKAQEEKRKALAARQAQLEKERNEHDAEESRKSQLRQARPGDKIYYSQDWTHSSLFGWVEENYKMEVICFVEENVDNGERMKIRVAEVKSSDSSHYSTPEIDGIKYRPGDVIWIKPLQNKGWKKRYW